MKRLIFFALLVVASAASAQAPPPLEESVSVSYVMVPFTVLGSKGNPITDLRQKEVRLFVDGVPVKSDMFEKSLNAPVSYTILLDGSGSMALAGKMEAARAAVQTLLAHRVPGDDYALYVFTDDDAHEVVRFTENAAAITRAMAAVKPYGKTAFFDALATMPERSRLGQNPTRAIILLSDAIDNASHMTRQQLAKELEGVPVPIYPLGLREPAEEDVLDPKQPREELSDIALLREVAGLTGGTLHLGNQPQQIASAIADIEKSLRAQYLIGFSPTGEGAVKYRRISLKLGGRIHSVNVRAGYRGTEPPALTSAATRTPKRNERKRS
ncbi:MAG: VWA domain-containing protein [Thermoanaerobaculia bacterium]